jgi:hypothetical protein
MSCSRFFLDELEILEIEEAAHEKVANENQDKEA